MELIPVPLALPGCCFICRSAERKFFIDLQYNIDREDNWGSFEGALYICSECLSEMAHMAKYTTPEESEELAQQLFVASNTIQILTERVEALEGLGNAIARLNRSNPRPYSDGNRTLPSDESDKESAEGTVSVGDGEGSPPESVHDERVELVSDDASSDAGFNLGL